MEIARQNIFREIDVLEEWLGLGHPALQRTLPWMAGTLGLGGLVSDWTVDRMAAADRSGIRIRPLVNAGQLFLLHHHRTCMPLT